MKMYKATYTETVTCYAYIRAENEIEAQKKFDKGETLDFEEDFSNRSVVNFVEVDKPDFVHGDDCSYCRSHK